MSTIARRRRSRATSPLDFIGLPAKPAVGALRVGARTAYNAYRLKRYLDEARQIPKGVREVGKDERMLTDSQKESLKRFYNNNRNYRPDIKVLNYSDGRALFSFRVPGKVPGSYAIYEKQVNAAGKVIRTRKTAVNPLGDLIHTKVK